MPVGKVTTGGLRTAFEYMAGERPPSQTIELIGFPAERIDTRTQRHGTVDTAPCNYDVRAQSQGPGDGKCTQIGIDTRDARRIREILVGKHLRKSPLGEGRLMDHQIITADNGYGQVKTCILDKLHGCSSTGLGIDPTGVGYQLHTLGSYVDQMWFQHRVDKVRGKTAVLISCAGSRHDRHRDLGKVIVNDVIQSTGCKQLGRGHCGFSPEPAGSTDPYGSLCHNLVILPWALTAGAYPTEPDRCPISRSLSACRFWPLTSKSGIWVQSSLLIGLISRSRRSTEVDGI